MTLKNCIDCCQWFCSYFRRHTHFQWLNIWAHRATSLFIHPSTDLSTSSQPENLQGTLLAPTAPSQAPPTDSSSPRSPQLPPQVPAGSQLDSPPSDGPPAAGCGPAPGSATRSDPQESTAGGEKAAAVKRQEAEEAKGDKKTHHCPTCKVTVNSSSQLESHCSGVF